VVTDDVLPAVDEPPDVDDEALRVLLAAELVVDDVDVLDCVNSTVDTARNAAMVRATTRVRIIRTRRRRALARAERGGSGGPTRRRFGEGNIGVGRHHRDLVLGMAPAMSSFSAGCVRGT
jgi:hypothetical protein